MQNSKYKLEWEHLSDGVALLHCTVTEWSMPIARRLDVSVNQLFRRLAKKGYHTGITVSPNPRFCEYMAGEHIGGIEWDGIQYEVYKWELD